MTQRRRSSKTQTYRTPLNKLIIYQLRQTEIYLYVNRIIYLEYLFVEKSHPTSF